MKDVSFNSGVESTTLTPTQAEGYTRKEMTQLRDAIVEEIDALFDSVQYDKFGYAVNNVSASLETEKFYLPAMNSLDASFTGERRVTIKVGSTLRDLEDQLAALKKSETVEHASAGAVVVRAVSEPEPEP